MNIHLRLGVRNASNRQEEALICQDLIKSFKEINTNEFGIKLVLYSPSLLRQIRNNVMIFLFKIRCSDLSILMTDLVEAIFGKRRNP